MSWHLLASLNIGGADFIIRTDFRVVLDILMAFNDPELPDYAKGQVMIEILFEDWESISPEHLEEALKKANAFIDCGNKPDKKKKHRMVDWEQDADLIIPAVNKIAGVGDIRSIPYMHWWTFMGYFMEIGECLFSSVLNIRHKKAHGKKMEKWETDFYKNNRHLVDFHVKLSEEEEPNAPESAKPYNGVIDFNIK